MQKQQQIQLDPAAEIAKIKALRAAARRRSTWGKSRLVKHRAELVKLRAAGGSFADLALWLRKEKRIVVERSTVMRFLEKQNG
jgi:hypothetical protein